MGNNPFKLRVISCCDELASLQPRWDKFASGASGASVYMRPDLLSLWWENFGGKDRPFILSRGFNLYGESSAPIELHVLVIEHSSEIVAYFPLMKVKVKSFGVEDSANAFCFLGDEIFSPMMTIMCKADLVDKLIKLVIEYFNQVNNWDVLLFFPVRNNDTTMQKFFEQAKNVFGDVGYSDLNEVLLSRGWNRSSVMIKLERLQGLLEDNNLVQEIGDYVYDLTSVSENDFYKNCISQWDPKLRKILNQIKGCKGEFVGVLGEIFKLIEFECPYVLSHVELPSSYDSYISALSKKKRHYLRADSKQASDMNLQIKYDKEIAQNVFSSFVQMHQNTHKKSAHLNFLTLDYYKSILECLAKHQMVRWITFARSNDVEPKLVNLYFLNKYMNSLDYVISGSQRGKINLGDLATFSAIKKAISENVSFFSFRLGSEEYKKRFNPVPIQLSCMVVSRFNKINFEAFLPKHLRVMKESVCEQE